MVGYLSWSVGTSKLVFAISIAGLARLDICCIIGLLRPATGLLIPSIYSNSSKFISDFAAVLFVGMKFYSPPSFLRLSDAMNYYSSY